MSKQELINKVSSLINTPTTKDGTDLGDWIAKGDTDDMTPEEIAVEWDEFPAMEIEQEEITFYVATDLA